MNKKIFAALAAASVVALPIAAQAAPTQTSVSKLSVRKYSKMGSQNLAAGTSTLTIVVAVLAIAGIVAIISSSDSP